MATIFNFFKNIFSSKLGSILGIVLILGAIYFILPNSIKDLSNWFVSAKEHRELVKEHEKLGKLYIEQQKKLDSMFVLVHKNDQEIKDLENKKVAIETKRTKLKWELKNAKGNIVTLDSLANAIL